jgi:hypothetical protein
MEARDCEARPYNVHFVYTGPDGVRLKGYSPGRAMWAQYRVGRHRVHVLVYAAGQLEARSVIRLCEEAAA